MFKHIIGQAILQFVIIILLTFGGDKFLPEYCDSNDSKLFNGHPYALKKFNRNFAISSFVSLNFRRLQRSGSLGETLHADWN